MQQPENLQNEDFNICLKIFSENDDVYKIISFNGFKNNNPEDERVELTKLEETYINKTYSKGGLKKFINIPIADYTPPTKQNLINLWSILDEFHILKKDNPKLNIVMHCTCGFGRTGTMIMSYLMYKIYKDTPKYTKPTENFEDIFTLRARIELSLRNSDNITALMKRDIMEYIKDQILNNYSEISYNEIFNDRSGSKYLMLRRLSIIIETIYSLFDKDILTNEI